MFRQKRRIGLKRLAVASLLLAALTPALAQQLAEAPPEPAWTTNFATACVMDAPQWRISSGLDKHVREQRLRCLPRDGGRNDGRILRIAIEPGDAFDPNLSSLPTERVEIQIKDELVKFDVTIWHSFLIKVETPWIGRENRTVVHQIKQNIAKRYEIGRGEEERCAAANPLFKIEVGSDGAQPVFRAKATGSESCGDSVGKSTFCGDWPFAADAWHRVHVLIRPSQIDGESRLKVWLDGRACPEYRGLLGYPRFGATRNGKPFIDTQPRFGIYRDALPDVRQAIQFDDISFWDRPPLGHPIWAGIALDGERAISGAQGPK